MSDNEMEDDQLSIHEDHSVVSFYGHIKMSENEDGEDDESTATGVDDSNCVYSVSISTDLKWCVSGGNDDFLRLWGPLPSNTEIFKYRFNDSVVSVDWNPKHPEIFYGADMSGIINVWTLRDSGMETPFVDSIFNWDFGMDIEWVCWHPTQSFLVVGLGETGTIYMFAIGKKEASNMSTPPRIFNGPGFRTTSHVWKNDQQIVVGYENSSLALWELKNPENSKFKLDMEKNRKFI